MAERDKDKSAQSVSDFVQEVRKQIQSIEIKLQRLLDGYLEQDIEREVYREKKAKLLSEKKSLEEQIYKLEQKQNDWLKPFQNWIKVASNLVKIASDDDLFEKKIIAKKIFGSNLRLDACEARGNPLPAYFAAQRATESIGKKSESLILVGRQGFEPWKAQGQQIYSLSRLTASVPTHGAVDRDRTGDLLLTMEMLYQLSYNGILFIVAHLYQIRSRMTTLSERINPILNRLDLRLIIG